MGHINRKYRVVCFVFLCVVSIFGLPLLISAQEDVIPFVVRINSGPETLDPLGAEDFGTIETIRQVCEGLYIYNYSSPEMEPIPCLAQSMGTWSYDMLNLTIELKEGVTFHDGSPFNAQAVKWNFDRLQYWTYGLDIDYDGDLENHPLGTASMASFESKEIPILNRTEIIDEYTVRFVLNTQAVIWESLLAFIPCSIMLPDPNYLYGYNFFNRIDNNDDLIGTGPFRLTEYSIDNEVVFDYNPNYHMTWGDNHIERMIYLIIPDDVTASLGVLNHEIHWGKVIPDYQDQGGDLALIEVACKREVVYFVQMNLFTMKDDYRYASSFVWNHSYFLEEVLGGRHYELHVPIPDGMQYHLADFEGESEYNYEAAQDILLNSADLDIQANLTSNGLTHLSTREEWRAVAEGLSPVAVLNYTRYQSGLVELVGILLQDYLKDIGIKLVILDSMPWDDWVKDFLENPDGHKRLCYSFGGRGPDYNDPITMIEPLYGTNASGNCFMLDNDTWNDMLLDSYSLTGNARRDKFYEIQEHYAKYQVPSFHLLQLGGSISFNREFLDEDYIRDLLNIFGHFYWFNCKFTPVGPPPNYFKLIFIPVLSFLGIIAIVVVIGVIVKRKSANKITKIPVKGKLFCPECGARVSNKLKICDYCGYLLEEKEVRKYIDDFKLPTPTKGIKFCPMCGSVVKNQKCTKCARDLSKHINT